MKKTLMKFLGLSLIFMLLLSNSLMVKNLKAEENNNGEELDWQVVETDNQRASKKLNSVDFDDEDQSKLRGNVRVSIVLEDNSTIDNGYSTETIGLDPGAIAYRESLQRKQDDIAKVISRDVLNGNALDVVWNLTLAANIISANVPADKIEEIKAIDGVKDVVIENQYFPQEDNVADEPNMSTASEMTYANYAWAQGYTGAGSTVAIVDTGLDIEHQSFDSYAFDMAIQDIKSRYGKDVNLLEAKDVRKLWASTNAYKAVGGDGAEAYLNSKVPFRFNYVDSDFDVTHLADTQGEHGSHVASIAAANKYIAVKEEDGSISLKNAITAVRSQGNAPDAQVLVMKVFGKGGGAYESDYFAAIEDAIVLGADAVNLSLGSSNAGMSYNTTYQSIIDGLTDVNIVWLNSAGNNSYWAEQTANGYTYAGDTNFQTGGSPATYSNTLSVASVDNKGFTGAYLQLNEDLLFYTESSYTNEPLVTIAGTHEYVYVDSFGTAEEFAQVKDVLEGKIALCSRGTTSFYQKANAAVENGAIATVIVNNQPGTINMNLTGYLYTQPVVSITLDDGNLIKQNSEMVELESGLTYYTGSIEVGKDITTKIDDNPIYTMSSFSSFGVPSSLRMKPEITAPGGNIYAAFGLNNGDNGLTGGHDKYENMSGTSMASPQMAGIVALMSQYIKENGLDQKAKEFGVSKRALVQSLLMSTAEPLQSEENREYYSILNQGAGLVDVNAAMNSDVFVKIENVEVNGENRQDISYAADGKVKAELGDDPERTGLYSVEFTLNNLSDEEKYFDLNGSIFTQDIFENEDGRFTDTLTYGLFGTNIYWYMNGLPIVDEDIPYDFNDDKDGVYDSKDAVAILDYVVGNRSSIGDMQYADLDNSGEITTYDAYLALQIANQANTVVPANGSTTLRADIVMDKEEIDQYDFNGAWIEGFLFANELESKDGAEGTSHSIPVLGYYGCYAEPGFTDVASALEFEYKLDDRLAYMDVSNALGAQAYTNEVLIAKHGALNVDYTLGGNPLGSKFDDGIYHPDRNAFNSSGTLTGARYTLIRNAAANKISLTHNDEVINEKETISSQYAAYYFPSQSTWRNTSANLSYGYKMSNAKEDEMYDLSLSFLPEYYVVDGEADWDKASNDLQLSFTIDNTAPVINSVFGKRLINEESNNIVVTISASDNAYIAGVFLYDETDELLGYEGSRTDDKKAGKPDNGDYAFIIDGTDVPDHLYAEIWDYAANITTVQINLNKEELEGDVAVNIEEDVYKLIVGSSDKVDYTVEPWGSSQEVEWTSSDESVVTVDQNGIITGIAEGSAIIRATSKQDPNAYDECTVNVVYIERELNGVIWNEVGDIFISRFKTNTLPEYEKISDDLNLDIASLTYDQNGTLYGVTFDSEEWLSSLYTIDEDTFETTLVGDSRIGYMDICPAPSLGDGTDRLLGVYGSYVTIIDKNSGDYVGVFDLSTYSGGNYFVGIAYEEQYYHPTYGNTDWVFLLDAQGNIYSTGFLPYNGATSRFGVTKVGSFGELTDTPYYQSLYYDGTDLYWSRYVDAENKVDILFVEDLYNVGDIYNLGSFNDGVWPVGGLYNENQLEMVGANHEDAQIDETAVFETEIAPIEFTSIKSKKNVTEEVVSTDDELPILETQPVEPAEEVIEETVQEPTVENQETQVQGETGTLDSAIIRVTNKLVNRYDTKADVDHDSDDIAIIEITAEQDSQHNGLYQIYFDSNYLTLRSVKANTEFHSYKDNGQGLITFGYIDSKGINKDETVVTLIFDKPNTTETTVNIETDELEDTKPYSSEVFVLDDKTPVEQITVTPEELTLLKGDTATLTVEVLPEDATDKSLTFTSSDPSIATVDENGNITAVKEGTVTIVITTNDGSQITKEVTVRVVPNSIDVLYRTHVQNIGWQSYVLNGGVSGTSGRSLRLEGIMIKLDDIKGCDLGIQYTTHVQNYGWMPWSSNGELSGTTGESLRLEAIKIQLTGADKDLYDVYYRSHAQNIGWLSWAKNGAPSGTADYSYRLEAIQILVVPKGQQVPENYGGIIPSSPKSYIHRTGSDNPKVIGENNTNIVYRSNVQGNGWLPYKYNGAWSGTSGQSKRLEALQIELRNKQYSGSIMYNVHVQNIGWQGWKEEGEVAGTVGRYLRLEAIKIQLTGELEEHYDVYYRLHVQNHGWMAWAKNGEQSGTSGQSLRVEAIQIVLVEKGSNPPSTSLLGVRQNSKYSFVTR